MTDRTVRPNQAGVLTHIVEGYYLGTCVCTYICMGTIRTVYMSTYKHIRIRTYIYTYTYVRCTQFKSTRPTSNGLWILVHYVELPSLFRRISFIQLYTSYLSLFLLDRPWTHYGQRSHPHRHLSYPSPLRPLNRPRFGTLRYIYTTFYTTKDKNINKQNYSDISLSPSDFYQGRC